MSILKNIKTSMGKTGGMILLLAALASGSAKAQLHPMGAIYFQNRYQINPALAGNEEGLFANAGIRQQWSNMPGAPKTQSLSMEYGSGKKSGVGLNLYNDEAGLQKRTRVMGTYSYHLPINDNGTKLSFGVSAGFSDDRLMYERLSSNVNGNDPSIGAYQDRETYFDGDFGAAFQSNGLNVELAVPNLKSFFKKDQNQTEVVDQSRLFSSISYKLNFPNSLDGMSLEPKVCYRQVQNYKDMVDLGANLTLAENKVNVTAMYHTTRSTTLGLGVKYQKYMVISGMFTSGTAAVREYTNGNFELNLRVNISEVFSVKK